MASKTSSERPTFDTARHIKFWLRCSSLIPTEYTSGDANRMSLAFFTVSALDLLGLLDPSHPKAISKTEKQSWTTWIYSLQHPEGGFRGFNGGNLGERRNLWNKGWDAPSLANSFLAMVSLLILGDDLGKVKRGEIARWVKGLQRPNGGFAEHMPGVVHAEEIARDDMRMCYCAAGIAYILGNDYVCMDKEKLRRFVVNAQAYEGGVGQSWGQEGHSGLNFCALACLELVRRLDTLWKHDPGWVFEQQGLDVDECVRYVLMRQTSWVEDESEDEDGDEGQDGTDVDATKNDSGIHMQEDDPFPIAGFNGRTNKMADTCYCYWNLASLEIIGITFRANRDSVKRYLLEVTQHKIGGFSKAPGEHPDLMHSYLGLAALAVMNQDGVKQLDPALCAGFDVRRKLAKLRWRRSEE